ncbi:pyroglutamylated RF-amide peptide receptor [Exaiptasia diaphana]|uniref:G-protein coupled receptors family 1 profile domain-containing protein n=1 Tax=Exaiptasia diaphana TaxID=2652724 RepID=A0A913X0V2_EXADI|nr:pyroglutamylated RF-amide peptide receptor [Exaiptasia diaphana]XP_020897170.1 pyroglutamylated RF-amide peptide receptor [Exaiptasia diaphana]KXJ16320.1 Pyroglutamylated RFamide peptide receptor [Exaiptasia diaphana]
MANKSNTTLYEVTVWAIQGPEFIASVVVLGLVSLVGLLGNALVVSIITTTRKRGQKTAVQIFILHLAVSDLMVCLLCIPLTLLVNFNFPSHVTNTEHNLCKVTRFTQFLAPSSSIAILTVISIDRFYSLVKPFKRNSAFTKPCVLLLTAWCYAAAIFVPTFYFAKMEGLDTTNGKMYYCITIPNNSLAGFIYLLFLFIASFLVPLITMIVLYSRVGKAVWSRVRKISRSRDTYISNSSLSVLERSRKRVTRMLLIVVVVFLICWSPFVIYTGFIERWVAPFPNPADSVRLITYCIGLFNSICNPFIYYFNSESSRKDSLKVVCFETAIRRATMKSYDNTAVHYRPSSGTAFTVFRDGRECYDTQF